MAREFREVIERINKEQIEGVDRAKWYAELQKGEDGNASGSWRRRRSSKTANSLLPGETPVGACAAAVPQ